MVAAFLFLLALQVHRVDDFDTWWHLATGRLIVETHAVPHEDPFSFTAAGAPWINRQWLFDLGAYAAWRLGGATALILGAGAFFLAGLGALYALARRRLPACAAAALVVLVSQAAVERFTVRPEAITWCFLPVFLLVLDRATPGWPALAGLLAMQVLWANCHALSVLGPIVLAAELVGAAAGLWLPLPRGWRSASRRDVASVGRLAVVTCAALAAEAMTPFGISGALFSLRLLNVLRGAEPTSMSVIEHKPPVLAQLSPPVAVAFVVLLGLGALACVLSWRRWRLAHLLTAGAFTALALMARRNVALVGLAVVPLFATALAPAAATAGEALARRPRVAALLAAMFALGLGLATADVVNGTYYLRAKLTRTFGLGVSGLVFSAGAVDFLDAHAPGVRLINDDALGGYLLWRDYPRRRVFIDGRFQVYPPQVYRDLEALWDPRNFPSLVSRYGIQGVILYPGAPGRLETAFAIAAMPGWRIAYLDVAAVVLLADGAPRGMPAGVTDPVLEGSPSLVDRFRPGVEEALAHYQRGRTVLLLLGAEGLPLARADFEAALRAWPGFDLARVALGVVNGS